MEIHGCKELAISENGIRGVDLFKIAGESISGWLPSWKLGGQKPALQPFCSLMEERLLMYLEYQPHVCLNLQNHHTPAHPFHDQLPV